jgi:hypothetical protein
VIGLACPHGKAQRLWNALRLATRDEGDANAGLDQKLIASFALLEQRDRRACIERTTKAKPGASSWVCSIKLRCWVPSSRKKLVRPRSMKRR